MISTKSAGRCLVSMGLYVLTVGASSNFLGSVHLPPGSAVEMPGTGAAWPASAWALEWWQQLAPVPDYAIQGGPLLAGCAGGSCTATIRGDGGTTLVLVAEPIRPYSVAAIRVEAEEVGATVHARLLFSGTVVAEGKIFGEGMAGPDLMIANLSADGHVFVGPVRLWSTADPPEWLFGDPAPSDPALVGMWRQVAGGVFVDVVAGRDGVLTGAGAGPPLCWERGTDLVGFTDGFESGDASRWSVTEGSAATRR